MGLGACIRAPVLFASQAGNTPWPHSSCAVAAAAWSECKCWIWARWRSCSRQRPHEHPAAADWLRARLSAFGGAAYQVSRALCSHLSPPHPCSRVLHTALLCRAAAREGHSACVQLLLDSGVNANQGMALDWAAVGGHVSVVQALMSAGVRPLWLHLWPMLSVLYVALRRTRFSNSCLLCCRARQRGGGGGVLSGRRGCPWRGGTRSCWRE